MFHRVRLWRVKRKGYTPDMAELYILITEYDWWEGNLFSNIVAMTPTFLALAMLKEMAMLKGKET